MQVIFFPSHNEYGDPAVTRRIMDYMAFMNSKVLFKNVSPPYLATNIQISDTSALLLVVL